MQVHAEFLRVLDVERVFGIDKSAGASQFLHLGNDLQRERGFAGALRTVDFDHAATRQATHAQGDVQAQGAGGHDLDVFNHLTLAQAHDGAFAELLFDLQQGGLQGLGFFGGGGSAGVDVEIAFDGCIHEKISLKIKQCVGCGRLLCTQPGFRFGV